MSVPAEQAEAEDADRARPPDPLVALIEAAQARVAESEEMVSSLRICLKQAELRLERDLAEVQRIRAQRKRREYRET